MQMQCRWNNHVAVKIGKLFKSKNGDLSFSMKEVIGDVGKNFYKIFLYPMKHNTN